MGRSDPYLKNFYFSNIKPNGATALLGFSNNNWFSGDLYDIQLGNWDINSDWKLEKKYDTIICTRCAYFAKDPVKFIEKCYDYLNQDGKLYVDWGLGDHWRFKDFKVGWVKNNEHEYAYFDENYLWSTVWDSVFLDHNQTKIFINNIKKFGYNDLQGAIFKEIPYVLKYDFIKKYFDVSYDIITLWNDLPQLYIIIKGKKI